MSNINLIIEDANFTYTSDLQDGLLRIKSLRKIIICILKLKFKNREKSLRHVAMVANVWMRTNR